MILIIDDPAVLGTQMRRFFRAHNYDATVIGNGIEALTSLHVKRPLLIILDLPLPGIDGMTLLRTIRQDPSFKNIPVLVYTSDNSVDVERQALAAGTQDFLIKGVTGFDLLLNRVRQLLPVPSGPPTLEPGDIEPA